MTKKVLKGIVPVQKIIKLLLLKLRENLNILFEKIIKRSKKYHAHDEKNKFKEGESFIIECKPYSKKKTWQVIEK